MANPEIYPWPGTKAEAVLAYVRANPGTSQNRAIRATDPSGSINTSREAIRGLSRRGLIRVETDERGYHTLWPAA